MRSRRRQRRNDTLTGGMHLIRATAGPRADSFVGMLLTATVLWKRVTTMVIQMTSTRKDLHTSIIDNAIENEALLWMTLAMSIVVTTAVAT